MSRKYNTIQIIASFSIEICKPFLSIWGYVTPLKNLLLLNSQKLNGIFVVLFGCILNFQTDITNKKSVKPGQHMLNFEFYTVKTIEMR